MKIPTLITCAAAFLSGFSPIFAQDDPVWIAAVKAAWSAREQEAKRFVIEWTEQRTTYSGHKVPRGGITHSVRFRIACDGPKMRWTRKGMNYSNRATVDAGVEREFTRVFDGRQRKELYNDDLIRKQAHGFMQDGIFEDLGNPEILPVIWQFRPGSKPHGGLDLSEWKISARQGSINGVPCRVLERFNLNLSNNRREESVGKQFVWIANRSRYPILREQVDAPDGTVVTEWTLSFDNQAQMPEFATGWKRVARTAQPQKLTETVLVQDAHLELNSIVAPSEFEFSFPPGTLVFNETTGKDGIIRPDGTLRMIVPGEAWKTTEQVLASDPPTSTSIFTITNWKLALGGALIVLLVAAVVRRVQS